MGVRFAKQGIENIKPHMIAGGNAAVPPAAIRLNSNESVFGPSPLAREAARAAASDIERYLESPDQLLAPALAERFGLRAEMITTGQGADDLLARLARAYLGPGTEMLRCVSGYLKTPNYAHANDAEVVSVKDDNLTTSVDALLAAVTDRTRLVTVANPENPAGTYISGSEVRRLHAGLPDNVLLVLDCAYAEFVDAEDYEPASRLVEEAENVVMCRTFSKIYGLAGARVGWMYAPEPIIDIVRRIGLTFPVSSTSVAAALAALRDTDHAERVYRANIAERQWLSAEMEALGLPVTPSQTNFLLVRFPDPDRSAEAADHYLRQRGIAIRRFAAPSFRDHIRITIGHRSELEAVRDGIAAFLRGDA